MKNLKKEVTNCYDSHSGRCSVHFWLFSLLFEGHSSFLASRRHLDEKNFGFINFELKFAELNQKIELIILQVQAIYTLLASSVHTCVL